MSELNWRLWTRMKAAMIAARRAFADPRVVTAGSPAGAGSRLTVYDERWAYAVSSAFDDLNEWAPRLTAYGLYAKTRGYYNPWGRLAQFYTSQVYPGFVPQGDGGVPRGARDALPFAPDMSPELRAAVLQIAQWSNWPTAKHLLVRLAASVGDCLVEVVDDLDRQKVGLRVWWPGYVPEFDLDPYGNLTRYVLEYDSWDSERKERFVYRIETTKTEIRSTRDGLPWSMDEDVPPTRPNPYGFAPACWVRHRLNGSPYGEPCLQGAPKMDLLNSNVSRIWDYVKTRIKAPYGIAATFDTEGLGPVDVAGQRTGAAADEFGMVGGGDTDEVFLMELPPDARGVPLYGSIDPWQSIELIDRTLTEIENDNPELAAWNKLREMSSVSGVAIERALGDATGRLYEAQSTYDTQVVKAFQMAAAIAGWRVRIGSWDRRDVARQKFQPFDLDSYGRGDLDFALLPRPLTPATETEEYEARTLRYAALQSGRAAGVPAAMVALDLGWTEEEAARIAAADDPMPSRASRRRELLPLGAPPGGGGAGT